jgi:hypothetical protein
MWSDAPDMFFVAAMILVVFEAAAANQLPLRVHRWRDMLNMVERGNIDDVRALLHEHSHTALHLEHEHIELIVSALRTHCPPQ